MRRNHVLPCCNQRRPLSLGIFILSCLVFLLACWLGPVQQTGGLEIGFVAVVMCCITLAIVFATGRLAFSLMLTGWLFLALIFAAYEKQVYLGNALLISDVYYMTGAGLIKTVSEYPHLRDIVVVGIVIFLLLLVLTWRYAWRPLAGWRRAWYWRVLTRIGGCAASVALLVWVLQVSGPFTALYTKSMWTAINQNAHLTSFFMSINVMKIQKPNVHDDAKQLANWNKIAAAGEGGGGQMRPDIIMVLEESTFKPSTLPVCDIPVCRGHSLIEPNKWTKAHGPMLSYVFGHGTWLSEYDILTGLPFGIFGPAGGYAPWLLAPKTRDSLPMQLDRLGYDTVAVYDVDGGYMNARQAYKHYGFKDFFDAPELGLPSWGATDKQMFDAAERVYKQQRAKTQKPIFLIVKTLAQHGPHNNHPLSSLPAPYNKGLFPQLSDHAELELSTYLARLDASDQAMQELEQFFLARKRPTIVLSFGDHKPSLGGEMAKLQITPPEGYHGDPKHLTYFKLDANFETPSLPHYPVTDIAFLPTMILQAGNLPMDAYFAASTHLRNVCNGLYASCSDKKTLYAYYGWLFSNHKVFE